MSDAVCWQVMNEIVDGLRTIAFEPVGGDLAGRISPDNIEIRKRAAPRSREENRSNVPVPRIEVSFVKARRDPRAGTNVRDDVMYVIAVEIIDRDQHERVDGERTYLKWMELVSRFVHNQVTNNVQTYDEGQVCISTTPDTESENGAFWEPHRLNKATVFAHYKVREPRGYDT